MEKKRRGNPDKIKGKGFDANPQNINRTGANRGSISEIMKELLQGNLIEYEFVITNNDGEKKIKKGKVESKTDLKTLMATLHISKSLNDLNAFRELLNRTEGSVVKPIDVTTNGENLNNSNQLPIINISPEDLLKAANFEK